MWFCQKYILHLCISAPSILHALITISGDFRAAFILWSFTAGFLLAIAIAIEIAREMRDTDNKHAAGRDIDIMFEKWTHVSNA